MLFLFSLTILIHSNLTNKTSEKKKRFKKTQLQPNIDLVQDPVKQECMAHSKPILENSKF